MEYIDDGMSLFLELNHGVAIEDVVDHLDKN
jgi:hypothetical protein